MNEFSEKYSHVGSYTIGCCFMCRFVLHVFYATLNINNKEKSKKVSSIKKSTKRNVATVPVPTILEIWELSITL